uniref:Uncharacterized protein n=1 Tax=Glossina morsitans morsitans TaxID=37546 RepID=A0A1B0FC23_GLOMM
MCISDTRARREISDIMEVQDSPRRRSEINERMEVQRSPRRRVSPPSGDARTEVQSSLRQRGQRCGRGSRRRGNRRRWRGGQRNGGQPNGNLQP